jgi:hypothetical protein
MLTVKELRVLSGQLKPDAFRKQLGPFVLVQKPEGPAPGGTDKMGLPVNVQRTAIMKPGQAQAAALALVFQFEDLSVATLPPLQGIDELTVGRQPDCDLVLEHPSVSKMHAVLRWDSEKNSCTVQDSGSTNGTFLNASTRVRKETVLRDGDIVSFGEVQYWYLLTETLHARLLGSASGSHRSV